MGRKNYDEYMHELGYDNPLPPAEQETPAIAGGAYSTKTPEATLNGDNLYEQYKDIYDSKVSAPPASPSYSDLAAQYLGSYANGTFSYDYNTDPLFQMAKQRYLQQGELNARDVAARAAALTGGYGNSYGTVAAQQAMNAANDNVNAIIPDLQNAAYSRWKDDQNRNLTLAQTYYQMANDQRNQEWEDILHARQQTEWGQQDEDRARNNDWEDVLHGRQQEEWTQQDEDRLKNNEWNEISHAMSIYSATGDSSALEALGLSAEKMEEAQKLQQALSIYSATGALGPLKALGIDVSTAEAKAALEEAMTYAQYHDYSKLKALGINTDYLELIDQLTLQSKMNAGSGGSGGSGGSSGGSKSGGGSTPSADYNTMLYDALLSEGYYSIGEKNGIVGFRNAAGNLRKFKYNASTGNYEEIK